MSEGILAQSGRITWISAGAGGVSEPISKSVWNDPNFAEANDGLVAGDRGYVSPVNGAATLLYVRGMEKKRCSWPGRHEIMKKYHDKEWGVPLKRDQKHFEFLCLESAQAGLSWLTILNKRENYRKAFVGFDPKKMARFNKAKIASLLKNPGIIRNRLKIEAAVNNAARFLEIQKEFGSFNKYCWQFVGGKPKVNRWRSLKQIPAKTKESDAFAKDLKKRGFKFLGSTTVYAHMQASGMVNDHLLSCYRYRQVRR